MNLSTLRQSTKALSKVINKNSPTILTALGVGGVITSIILAIKATPKALENIEREKRFRVEEEFGTPRDSFEYIEAIENTKLEIFDIFELTWKEYVPTVGMATLTIGCMIGANSIHLRRNAALASLFSITETALREYQAKVVEQIGDVKEKKIRGAIVQDHLDQNPVDEKAIIVTGNGDYLCYDEFSGRYFMSDVEKLRQAENNFNQRLIREDWLNINHLYYDLGLEPIEMGDEFGWIAERELLELKFDTKMAANSKPCLVVGYRVSPHHI